MPLLSFMPSWRGQGKCLPPHSPLSIHHKNLLYRIPVTLENANRLLTNKSNPPGKEMRNLDTAVLWQPQKCTVVFATETIVLGTLRLRSGGLASAERHSGTSGLTRVSQRLHRKEQADKKHMSDSYLAVHFHNNSHCTLRQVTILFFPTLTSLNFIPLPTAPSTFVNLASQLNSKDL